MPMAVRTRARLPNTRCTRGLAHTQKRIVGGTALVVCTTFMLYIDKNAQVESLRFCNSAHLLNKGCRREDLASEDPEPRIVRPSARLAPILSLDGRLASADQRIAFRLVMRDDPIGAAEEGREEARCHLQLRRLARIGSAGAEVSQGLRLTTVEDVPIADIDGPPEKSGPVLQGVLGSDTVEGVRLQIRDHHLLLRIPSARNVSGQVEIRLNLHWLAPC